MFNSLFGVLTKKNVFDKSASIFLDCGSVEWEIWIPKTALDRLPFPGEEARIFTYLYHHEDLMKIYGFLSPEDRSLFLDLLTVEGIGPSAALKIMSSMETNVFVKALEEDDITVLEKAAGKKTAQKLILKLKGKLVVSPSEGVSGKNEFEDVVTALCSMGFDRKIVEPAVDKAAREILKAEPGIPRDELEKRLFKEIIVRLSTH